VLLSLISIGVIEVVEISDEKHSASSVGEDSKEPLSVTGKCEGKIDNLMYILY